MCGLPIENSRCVDEISSQPFRKFCRLFKNFYQPSRISRLPTCLIRHHRRQPARTARNAADWLCRPGNGRHEWRPYVLRRQLRTAITLGAGRNVADCLCRPGTGCHEWRPYVLRRQLRTAITLGAARNAADCLCRPGNGRHEWRPYVRRRQPHIAINAGHRAGTRRTACAVPAPGVMNGATAFHCSIEFPAATPRSFRPFALPLHKKYSLYLCTNSPLKRCTA